jgi:hypothetical protein
MAEVGIAAAQGGDPSAATFRRLRAIAESDPLRTEPFLVEGAMAERAGAYGRARRLLIEARRRDPRSIAARYLLADTAVRQGRIIDGLREMAVLSRLIPDASIQLVPALAQYALTAGSHNQLATILAQNPQLKTPLLIALATNPDNADLIVALAGPPTSISDKSRRAWQARLLAGMVTRGEYRRAYGYWRRFAAGMMRPQELLFNGEFRDVTAPPPFNWTFSASMAGLAEPGERRLRVLYYGRQDAVLARQLLMLSPGRYRFQSPITGDVVAGALTWTLSCANRKGAFMELQLASSPGASASFNVPTDCPAQWLLLNGHMEVSPQDSNVAIGPLDVERLSR